MLISGCILLFLRAVLRVLRAIKQRFYVWMGVVDGLQKAVRPTSPVSVVKAMG